MSESSGEIDNSPVTVLTPPEDNQVKDRLFNESCTRGITEALTGIDRDFVLTPNIENQLAFHNDTHTNGVILRTERILKAVQQVDRDATRPLVTDRDIVLGKFAAAWHDVVQNWEHPVVDGVEDVTKRQKSKGNERASADRAIAFMKAENKQAGEEIYTIDDMETVEDAIMLTMPHFDADLGVVTQPDLADFKYHPVVQAVALADLGAAGMDGFEAFKWNADALFVEENMDIAAFLRGEGGVGQEEEFKARVLNWMSVESKFILGRQRQSWQEINSLQEKAQGPVRKLFSTYDDNFNSLVTLTAKRREMSPVELFDDIKSSLLAKPN
jgi:hypothetical protein